MHAGLYLVHAHPSRSVRNGSHHAFHSTCIGLTDNYFESVHFLFLFFYSVVFTYQANGEYPQGSSGLAVSEYARYRPSTVLYLVYNTVTYLSTCHTPCPL